MRGECVRRSLTLRSNERACSTPRRHLRGKGSEGGPRSRRDDVGSIPHLPFIPPDQYLECSARKQARRRRQTGSESNSDLRMGTDAALSLGYRACRSPGAVAASTAPRPSGRSSSEAMCEGHASARTNGTGVTGLVPATTLFDDRSSRRTDDLADAFACHARPRASPSARQRRASAAPSREIAPVYRKLFLACARLDHPVSLAGDQAYSRLLRETSRPKRAIPPWRRASRRVRQCPTRRPAAAPRGDDVNHLDRRSATDVTFSRTGSAATSERDLFASGCCDPHPGGCLSGDRLGTPAQFRRRGPDRDPAVHDRGNTGERRRP